MDAGIFTFGEMKTAAMDLIRDPSSKVSTVLGDEINDEYMRLVQAFDWPELRRIDTSLSTVSGKPRFYCPSECLTPIALLDMTQDRFLNPIPVDQAVYWRPSTFDSLSYVVNWSTVADSGRTKDMVQAEQFKVKGGRSGGVSVYVYFLDSNRVFRRELISTDAFSTSSYGISSAGVALEILRVVVNGSVSSNTVNLTVAGSVTSTEYCDIPKYHRTDIRKVLYLTRTPSSSSSVALVYKLAPERLKNDDEVPVIPVGHYLSRWASASVLQFDGKYQEAEFHYREALKMLVSALDNSSSGGADMVQPRPLMRPAGFRRISAWRQTRG